jgi:hypothetical protein
MLVQSGLEVGLLLCKSLQNLCGMIDRSQFRQELAARWARVSRVVQHFELIFPDLDIDGPRLLLDQNAVDAGTLWAERSAILRDLGTAIAGVENFDDRADLQGFH